MRVRTYVRLPIGLLLKHVERVKAEARLNGLDPDVQVGQWCQMVALRIAIGELEDDSFLDEIKEFNDNPMFFGKKKRGKN